jgi:hypothetical protein
MLKWRRTLIFKAAQHPSQQKCRGKSFSLTLHPGLIKLVYNKLADKELVLVEFSIAFSNHSYL